MIIDTSNPGAAVRASDNHAVRRGFWRGFARRIGPVLLTGAAFAFAACGAGEEDGSADSGRDAASAPLAVEDTPLTAESRYTAQALVEDPETGESSSSTYEVLTVVTAAPEQSRSVPGLYAAIMREANAREKASHDQAQAAFRDALIGYAPGEDFGWRPWSLQQNWTVVFENAAVLSLEEGLYEYKGGAHPVSFTAGRTFMKSSGDRVLLRDLIAGGVENETLINRLALGLAEEKAARDAGGDLVEAGQKIRSLVPVLEDNWVLAGSRIQGLASGVVVHFDPYETGAYAEGAYAIYVPWDVLQADLTSAGRQLFGGERQTR